MHKYFASFAAGVPSLIFSNGRDLLIGDIHGNSLRTLIHSQNRGIAVGVDFHYNLRRIFWTDTIQNKVFYLSNFHIKCYLYVFITMYLLCLGNNLDGVDQFLVGGNT